MKTFKGGALRRHADRQYKIQGRPQNGRNGGNMPPGRAGGESGLALGVGTWRVAELKVPARFFDMGSELQVRAPGVFPEVFFRCRVAVGEARYMLSA